MHMPGRGDNNKSGSAGRGANNQSNQGFGQAADKGKSDHEKGEVKGGQPSKEQSKTKDQSANRNQSVDKNN